MFIVGTDEGMCVQKSGWEKREGRGGTVVKFADNPIMGVILRGIWDWELEIIFKI